MKKNPSKYKVHIEYKDGRSIIEFTDANSQFEATENVLLHSPKDYKNCYAERIEDENKEDKDKR